MKQIGYIFLVHAYIPYVLNHFFEDWLYEAIDEVYIRMIITLRKLFREKTPIKIMMDIVPATVDQLKNEMVKRRFEQYLLRKIEKYANDEKAFEVKNLPGYSSLARYFAEEKEKSLAFYREIEGDLIGEFIDLQEKGMIQIGTSALTHPILPLLSEDSQRKQIDGAVEYHTETFGTRPAFFWSPECVIYPKLENLLRENGIEVLFIEGFPTIDISKNSTLYPCRLPSGLKVFGRHGSSVRFLWDRQKGFAGNPEYKDFYHEYKRVTDRSGKQEKELYDIQAVKGRIKEDVHTFIKYRLEPEFRYRNYHNDSQLCITHPIDAEFWGHWCYEGWDFVYELAKQLEKNDMIEFVFANEYIAKNRIFQKLTKLPLSSWGIHGNLDQWLTTGTVNMSKTGEPRLINYMWEMEAKYWEIARNKRNNELEGMNQRVVNQMLRELLIAQHSDWLFMYVNGNGDYAVDRVREHHTKFMELLDMYQNKVNEGRLKEIESEDMLFKNR